MLSLEEAQSAIANGIVKAEAIESVALTNARGRYLAQSVMAEVDNPVFDNSAMDGYAVNTEQLVTGNFRLPLAGESSAGDSPTPLAANTSNAVMSAGSESAWVSLPINKGPVMPCACRRNGA